MSHIYAQPQKTDSTIPSKSIVVFGDSLSAAYNIEREQGWVSLLQNLLNEKSLGTRLINASISGETTSGGLERLPRLLTKHEPDIVILELGGNDGLRGFKLEVTRENLTKMIVMSQEAGAKVLLAGIQMPPNLGRTYTRRFAKIYDDLGKLDSVELIPFILKDVATNPELMQTDRIHPNAEGQPIIMRTVFEYLSPLIGIQSSGPPPE